MDARIDISAGVSSRHRIADAALQRIDVVAILSAEIFKKTPCFPGLKPASRDLAKDVREIAGMPLPTADTGETFFNAKLTDKDLAARQTKRMLRATNHVSGTMWKNARKIGPAAIGAAAKSCRAHEKRCYADI